MREINDDDVTRMVGARPLIDACALCLGELGRGTAWQAPKQILPGARAGGFFLSLAAVVPAAGWAISKWASYVPAAPGEAGASTSTILISPAHGAPPVAVLTGMAATTLRTAATTIAVIERLRGLTPDTTVGLIGFGPVNESVARMLAEVAGIASWRVLTRTSASGQRAQAVLRSVCGAPGEVRTATHREVLADCTVVISATGAATALADMAELDPDVLVVSLDGPTTWNIAAGTVIDDHVDSAGCSAVAEIFAAASEVPVGRVFVDLAGSAVTDVALASVLLRALESEERR